MPLIRFPTVKGLVYTIDLSKIANRENPRTVEAPIDSYGGYVQEKTIVDWGDGSSTAYETGEALKYPTHEYAEDAGDVFTIVIRSATGKLPFMRFTDAYNTDPANTKYNVTEALVSLDHFGGSNGNPNEPTTAPPYCNATKNCRHFDTRFFGQQMYRNMMHALQNSGITQPLESFCFDFCTLDYTAQPAFSNVFNSCTGLYGSIPEKLFYNNTEIVSFYNVFFGCTGLTGNIPAGLFANNTKVTNFGAVFSGCSGLTGSIPAGLFDNNPEVLTFSATFRGCTHLTGELPEGFFDNNTKVETFNQTFYSADISGAIPAGLFDNNTRATSFTSAFYGCENLTEIPQGLFDNHTAITNVQSLFHNCKKITTPYKFWNDDGTTKSQFASLTTTLNCYLGCTKMDLTKVPTAYGGTMTTS